MLRRGLVAALLLSMLGILLTLVTVRALKLYTTLVRDETPNAPLRHAETAELRAVQVPRVSDPAPVQPERVLERRMSVVGLGWDRLGPALIANGGRTPGSASWFSAAGLVVTISPVQSLREVAEALARGGNDPNGADVAILPLPPWLSIQGQLGPIRPVVFYVAGWSRGREAVFDNRASTTDAGVDPSEKMRVGSDGFDAAYLALFGLESSGIPLANVMVVPPGVDPPPQWDAVDLTNWDAPNPIGDRPLPKWTTASASGLIPTVMVASAPWVEANSATLVVWLRAWLAGVGKLSGDVATGARELARIEGAPGPLALMRELSTWTPCSLQENLMLFELDGPSGQSLQDVMRRIWRTLYDARLVTQPAPHHLPTDSRVVEAALRARAPLHVGSSVTWSSFADDDAMGRTTVLTRPVTSVDGHSLGRALEELGGIFPSSVLRVTLREDDGPLVSAFALARDLYPIPQTVVVAASNPALSTPATIEVLMP